MQSENAFNLDQAEILSFGKELTDLISLYMNTVKYFESYVKKISGMSTHLMFTDGIIQRVIVETLVSGIQHFLGSM